MLVDSGSGSVEVKDLMVIEKYSHVMHIVSEVQGQLTHEQDAFDVYAFPAGTLSGAPKVRAMQIIDDLEHDRRGIYGGAVGYFGADGNADFGIAIRTMVGVGDEFTLQAGAGIVADSDPEMETDETNTKPVRSFGPLRQHRQKRQVIDKEPNVAVSTVYRNVKGLKTAIKDVGRLERFLSFSPSMASAQLWYNLDLLKR